MERLTRKTVTKLDMSQSGVYDFDQTDEIDLSSKKKRRRALNSALTIKHTILKMLQSRWFRRGILAIANLIFVVTLIQSNTNVTVSSPGLPFPPLRAPMRLHHVNGKHIMEHVGYLKKPQVLGVYFTNNTSSSYERVQVLPTHLRRQLTHNIVPESLAAIQAQIHLLSSSDYDEGRQDPLEHGSCKAQYDWMLMSFPTCNSVHEMDLTDLQATSKQSMRVAILGSGFWRDVWKIKHGIINEQVVLKSLRYKHEWEDRNYDRHRRDAVATERLTWSPNIVNIYAYCGNSGVYEFAPGGDIDEALFYSDAPKWNSTERLVVAFQVASAIADAHDSERNGIPTLAHTDITTAQFVHMDGTYKLNDFNRCRFIPVNQRTNENCGFNVGNNPGTFRAPEEYAYDLESEKVDIYSMGNIFYVLLTDQWPFEEDDSKEAQRSIVNGARPPIPEALKHSKDPAHIALRKVMALCWNQIPDQRPTAKEVKTILVIELKKLGLKS